jgi:hypothetical protein
MNIRFQKITLEFHIPTLTLIRTHIFGETVELRGITKLFCYIGQVVSLRIKDTGKPQFFDISYVPSRPYIPKHDQGH